MADVVFEESGGGLARVTLRRAEKSNALTCAMVERLAEIFNDIASRTDLRAVVLCAEGEAFSVGTDIEDLETVDDEGARATLAHGRSVCDLIESCRVPVIAAVGGLAAGLGFELVLACHIRIASEEARFSLSEAKLEVSSAHEGKRRLMRLKSGGSAIETLLTGAEVAAAEALRSGLINRVVEREKVLYEAEQLAREVASLAPLAIRACLEAVIRGAEMSLSEGLELEAELFSRLFDSEDMREGTSAFLEKRSPVFKGQ